MCADSGATGDKQQLCPGMKVLGVSGHESKAIVLSCWRVSLAMMTMLMIPH